MLYGFSSVSDLFNICGLYWSASRRVGEQQLSKIGQQLKEKFVCAPWMICEPNEREGKKLLAEIMQGGNFGQYDTRDAALKKGGMMKHGVWKLKRVMRLVRSYPEEALWEPVFRVWHLGWRKVQRIKD